MVDDPVVLCTSGRNSMLFYKPLGPRKSRAAFFFYSFSWVWPSAPADRASSGSSHQPGSGTATCRCTHVSKRVFNLSCFLFTTLAGMKSSNPCQNLSIHCVPAHATPDVFFRVGTLRRNSHFPCTTFKLKIFFSVPTRSTIGIQKHVETMLICAS